MKKLSVLVCLGLFVTGCTSKEIAFSYTGGLILIGLVIGYFFGANAQTLIHDDDNTQKNQKS